VKKYLQVVHPTSKACGQRREKKGGCLHAWRGPTWIKELKKALRKHADEEKTNSVE
jgi:hypothetical protein